MFETSEQIEKPLDGSLFFDKYLEKRTFPSLDDVCSENVCDENELVGVIEKVSTEILDYCKKHSNVTDDEMSEKIDAIYRIYCATKEKRSDLNKSLSNYELFIKKFAKGYGQEVLANFGHRLRRFIEVTIHPSRELYIHSEKHRLWSFGKSSIYMHDDDWVAFKPNTRNDSREYVSSDAYTEAKELLASNYKPPELYHVTGSAALEGIGKEQALMSAKELVKRGGSIKTGEFVDYIGNEGHSVSGGKDGLRNIYMSRGIAVGYATVRWFDEFDITFGFNEQTLREYLETNSPGVYSLRDMAGEGITVGRIVPLELISVIYAKKVNVPKVETWMKENMINKRVISFEADSLIREMSYEWKHCRMNRYEGIVKSQL